MTHGLQHRELVERSGTVAGVRGDGEASGARGEDGGLNQLAIQRMQRAPIDADLDESGLDTINARSRFGDPSCGQGCGGFAPGVVWQIFELPGTIESGVGPDLDARLLCQPRQELRIPAKKIRGAFKQPAAAERLDGFEMRQRKGGHFIRVVTSGLDHGGTYKVDHDVFVDKNAGLRCRLCGKWSK